MSKNIMLCSPSVVKEKSYLQENVDEKYIIHAIKYCQDVYIEEICGSDLFRGLQTRIENNSLSANDEILLKEYIHDALIYFVLAELSLHTSLKFWNKGLLQKSADNAIVPDIREIQKIAQIFKDKGEWYANRLKGYLKEYYTLYPEYANYVSNNDKIAPSNSVFRTSIYLGDSGKCECNSESCYKCIKN